MVLRRLKLYKFTQKLRAPVDQIPQCAACFASFVLEAESVFQQGRDVFPTAWGMPIPGCVVPQKT